MIREYINIVEGLRITDDWHFYLFNLIDFYVKV